MSGKSIDVMADYVRQIEELAQDTVDMRKELATMPYAEYGKTVALVREAADALYMAKSELRSVIGLEYMKESGL